MCVCSLKVTVLQLPGSWRQTSKSPALCSCVKCEQSGGWLCGLEISSGEKEAGWAVPAAFLPNELGSFQESHGSCLRTFTQPMTPGGGFFSQQPQRRSYITLRGIGAPGWHARTQTQGVQARWVCTWQRSKWVPYTVECELWQSWEGWLMPDKSYLICTRYCVTFSSSFCCIGSKRKTFCKANMKQTKSGAKKDFMRLSYFSASLSF